MNRDRGKAACCPACFFLRPLPKRAGEKCRFSRPIETVMESRNSPTNTAADRLARRGYLSQGRTCPITRIPAAVRAVHDRNAGACCPPPCVFSMAASLQRVFAWTQYQFVREEFARPLISTSSLSRKRSGVRIPSGLQKSIVIDYYALRLLARTLICCEGRFSSVRMVK